MKQVIQHPFEPVYDSKSKVLILGSLPSPKSRELGFYYGHPQNRFWKVLAHIFGETIPITIEEKRIFLLKHHIALWDVIQSCQIKGASDSSITSVKVNDIASLLKKTNIKYIITTGKKAEALYQKYCFCHTNIVSFCFPSTSPANCIMKEIQLIEIYSQIKKWII